MAGLALDTSVIVSALMARHEHHARAASALTRALAGSEPVIVPIPALVESYSVLTRLPPPFRIGPDAAREALALTFEGRASLAAPQADGFWRFLASLVPLQVAGGATYDAVILECARAAGAAALLTFNARDFERLAAPLDIEIRVP